MQFTVENEALVKAMAFVRGCIGDSATIAILKSIVITAGDGRASVRACDLGREAEASFAACVAAPGSWAVPGEVLSGLVGKLIRKGRAAFSLDANGRLILQSGSSRYAMRVLDAKDAPHLVRRADDAGVATFNVHAQTLRSMLKDASIAALKSHPSFFSQGVHLCVEGSSLVAVATDHHRLVRVETAAPTGAAVMVPITIKLDSVAEICRLLGTAEEPDVSLIVAESMIELQVGAHTFRSMLMACTFPAYQRIVPEAKDRPEVTFRPYPLQEAIARAALVYATAKKDEVATGLVQLTIAKDTMLIEAGKVGSETAAEEIECESHGVEVSFAMEARYLLGMLGTIPEDAVVRMLWASDSANVRFLNDKRPELLHVIAQSKSIRRARAQQAADRTAA